MKILVITNLNGPHPAHRHIIDGLEEFGRVYILKIKPYEINKVKIYYKKIEPDLIFFEDITLSKILNFVDMKAKKFGIAADRLIYALFFKPKWYLEEGRIRAKLYQYKYLDFILTKKGIEKLDFVFAVSKLMKTLISKVNEKVGIVYPTPTMEKYYNPQIKFLKEKEKILLSISRGGTFKGLDLLLRSFNIAKREDKELKLIVLTNIFELRRYAKLIKSIKRIWTHDIMFILKKIPEKNLIKLFGRSIIYLQTSYFDPCPVSVFDAIIFENLPIVTRYVGSKDFVEREFITYLDENDIANKILRVFEVNKEKIVKKMKQKIKEVFYKNQKKKFINLLEKLL